MNASCVVLASVALEVDMVDILVVAMVALWFGVMAFLYLALSEERADRLRERQVEVEIHALSKRYRQLYGPR